MQEEGRWRVLDGAGSVAVGVVLLVIGGWTGWQVSTLPQQVSMFAEMGSTEFPVFTRLVWGAGRFGILMVLSVALLLGGFACLFVIRDRFRANVYGLVVAMLLASLAIIVRLATWLPLFKVMQEMGQ